MNSTFYGESEHEADYARGFERCLVTFIDILGYRQLLKSRNASDIVKIVHALREFAAGDANNEDPPRRMDEVRMHTQSFSESVSDAVVRVRTIDTQYPGGSFVNELIDLMHATIECVNEGIFIRGGMTIGPAYVGYDGKGPIFGTAMVRAYEIEENEAVYPRIMIDDNALNTYLNDKSLWHDEEFNKIEARIVSRLIAVAEDGSYFVDYLRGAGPSEFDEDSKGYFDFLKKHHSLISANINATDGKVKRKYVWLANYHNKFIEELHDVYDMDDSSGVFLNEVGKNPKELLSSLIINIPSNDIKAIINKLTEN